MFAGFLLYLLWEAMLISYLSMRTMILPFNSLETLVSKSDYDIALIPDSTMQSSFELGTSPVWKQAWEERVKPNLDLYKSIPINGKCIFRFEFH